MSGRTHDFTISMTHFRYLKPPVVAALIIALTAALHIYYFIGFGLGDDVNEAISATNLLLDGLNPEDHFHYRLLILVPRAFSYWIFGINEVGFIAPIFLASIITQILATTLAHKILGWRAALITALLFLVTPFESLCSTANIPDYIAAVWGLSLTFCALNGLEKRHLGWIFAATVFAYCGLLTRISGITVYLACAVATLFSLRKYLREWLVFWALAPAYLGLHCIWSWHFAGEPLKWFRMSLLANYDVTDILDVVLWSYPRYLWFRDDFQNFMFGASGWIAAGGFILAGLRCLLSSGLTTNKASAPERIKAERVLLVLAAFVILVEFVPHNLSLTRYYSHQRIFRYMAQFSAIIYLLGAYFIENCAKVFVIRKVPTLALMVILLVSGFGILEIEPTTFPSRDSNADYRAIRSYLGANPPPAGTSLFADSWDFGMTLPLLYPLRTQWKENPMNSDLPEQHRRFLDNLSPGILITGGAYLPWYANQAMNLDLSPLNYKIPPNWKLLMQRDAAVQPWRREPLRIWEVEPRTGGEPGAAQ